MSTMCLLQEIYILATGDLINILAELMHTYVHFWHEQYKIYRTCLISAQIYYCYYNFADSHPSLSYVLIKVIYVLSIK